MLQPLMPKKLKLTLSMKQRRCPFHHRVQKLEVKDTWSNSKVWPWSTKWSRAKSELFQKNTLVIPNSFFQQHKRWFYISVQFSHSVVSDSLRPHESQHARPPCPSPTPGVHSNSRPSSRWHHPAISSSVVPFSSCPQSLLASESFPMSQLFARGGQSTGASALASFPEHHQMVNTEIRLIIFFAAEDGEALISHQNQDQELTVA